jgi:hypothetical protein
MSPFNQLVADITVKLLTLSKSLLGSLDLVLGLPIRSACRLGGCF